MDKYVETIQQLPKEFSSRFIYFHKRTSDIWIFQVFCHCHWSGSNADATEDNWTI